MTKVNQKDDQKYSVSLFYFLLIYVDLHCTQILRYIQWLGIETLNLRKETEGQLHYHSGKSRERLKVSARIKVQPAPHQCAEVATSSISQPSPREANLYISFSSSVPKLSPQKQPCLVFPGYCCQLLSHSSECNKGFMSLT